MNVAIVAGVGGFPSSHRFSLDEGAIQAEDYLACRLSAGKCVLHAGVSLVGDIAGFVEAPAWLVPLL